MKWLFAITLVLACIVQAVEAQTRVIDCGTPPPSAVYAPQLHDLRSSRGENVQATYPLLMKLFVTVVANDDGTSVSAGDSSIFRQLENMREFYAPHNICFIYAGKQQVNNTDLNMQDVSTEVNELSPFVVPEMLNVFIHTGLVSGTTPLNGYSYGIPGTIVSIISSAIQSVSNRSTLTHEIGHSFGLIHTHETGIAAENVARSGDCMNCWEAGDLLCDTPADPDLDSFGVDSNCIYLGNITDGCGWNYVPNTNNIMAYGNRACRNMFTLGQGATARIWIESAPFLIQSTAPDDLTMTFSYSQSSGRSFLLSRNTIAINSPSYQITGTTQLQMTSTKIILQPGVRFSPGSSGYVRMQQNILCQ